MTSPRRGSASKIKKVAASEGAGGILDDHFNNQIGTAVKKREPSFIVINLPGEPLRP